MASGSSFQRGPANPRFGKPTQGWRERLYVLIFEADTRAGRLVDLLLIGAIVISVAVVVMDSVPAIALQFGAGLDLAEWLFTLLFTLEYLLRLICVRHPLRYATSLFGVIDLLAILPTYIALFVPEAYALIDIRVLRLLRIFRILKLALYVAEYSILLSALAASRRKILVFLSFVMVVVLLMGTAMYVVEGPQHGFTSIPTAVYWAITAVTTVGFGDLVPKTDIGRTIASVMMWLSKPRILGAKLRSSRSEARTSTAATPSPKSEFTMAVRIDPSKT